MKWRTSARVDDHRKDQRVQAGSVSFEELDKSGFVLTPGRHVARGPAALAPPRAEVLLRRHEEIAEETRGLDALISGAASSWQGLHTSGPRQDDPFGGKVPSSWRIVRLATLLSEATDRPTDRPDKPIRGGPSGTALTGAMYTATGVPVVMPQDIGDNVLCTDRVKYVAEETARRLDSFRLRTGDIVLARRGEMGGGRWCVPSRTAGCSAPAASASAAATSSSPATSRRTWGGRTSATG
ncbi:hypothetical protein ACFQ9X_22445 [Catenulispora yoronensis]